MIAPLAPDQFSSKRLFQCTSICITKSTVRWTLDADPLNEIAERQLTNKEKRDICDFSELPSI